MEQKIDYEKYIKALQARRFLPAFYKTAAEAKEAALSLMKGKSVGIGGSVTVRELGLYEALQEQGGSVYWHWAAPVGEKAAVRDKALQAQAYLCSANAVTEDGKLLYIDGTGNRLAGLIYGPAEAVVIVGKNKLTGSVEEGVERTKRECCPKNARRLGMDTPCARTGQCLDCRGAARMCNVTAVLEAPTRRVAAFHVLLVDEELGL